METINPFIEHDDVSLTKNRNEAFFNTWSIGQTYSLIRATNARSVNSSGSFLDDGVVSEVPSPLHIHNM